MSWWLLLLAAGASLFLVVAGAVAAVLVLALRRPTHHPYNPDDTPSPLERACAAASALTPTEWQEFLRWVDGRRPLPPSSGEGITR
jgi:hypothetical protein